MKQSKKMIKTRQPTKKIKSFSLDDSIYVELQELFNKSDSHISLSILVNNYLKQLLAYLKEAEETISLEKSDLPLTDIIYNTLKIEYFNSMSTEYLKESIKLLDIEQFRNLIRSGAMTPLFSNDRIRNLIDTHEASKLGMKIDDYSRMKEEREFGHIEGQDGLKVKAKKIK